MTGSLQLQMQLPGVEEEAVTPSKQFEAVLAEKHRTRAALEAEGYLPPMDPPYHYERHGDEVTRNYPARLR